MRLVTWGMDCEGRLSTRETLSAKITCAGGKHLGLIASGQDDGMIFRIIDQPVPLKTVES
jgi:hypothetical protein